jgi:hypothetical protein
MPLRPGSSRDVIQSNIREMMAAGHAPKQAIAASLDNARRHALGGMVNRRFAAGGLWGEDNNLFASTPGSVPASQQTQAPVINYAPSIYGTPGTQMQPMQQMGGQNPMMARGGPVRRFATGGLFDTPTNSNQQTSNPWSTAKPQASNNSTAMAPTATPQTSNYSTAATPTATAAPYQQPTYQYPGQPVYQAGSPPPGWQPDPTMVQLAGYPNPPGFQPNPYYALATGGANYLPRPQTAMYSHYVPDAQYQALQQIPSGTTGRALIPYLPAGLRPQGTPGQIADLQNTYNQLNAAWQADPTNIEARTQVALANQALMTAQYGPMWQQINSLTDVDDLLRKLQPQSALYRPPKPMTKWDYAAQYGYGEMSHPRTGRVFDPTQKHDFGNALQTLRAAGWDPSMGYGPQAFTTPLSNGQQRPAAQQQMLNSLLHAVGPASPDYDYTAGGRLRERIQAARASRTGIRAAMAAHAGTNSGGGGGGGSSSRDSSGPRSPAQILRTIDRSLGPDGKTLPKSLQKYLPGDYPDDRRNLTDTTEDTRQARGGPVGGLGQTRRGPPGEPSDPAIFMPVVR